MAKPERKITAHAYALVIKRNLAVEKEKCGDYNVRGNVIRGEIVRSCTKFKEHVMLTLNYHCSIDKELTRDINYQDWCIKVWYEPYRYILIPIKILDHIEEVTRFQFGA